MKLSKAQQEVVDKMREGWILKRLEHRWYLCRTDIIQFKNVSSSTINKLLSIKAIECQEQNAIRHTADIFRLTEQYKNEQK